MNCIRRICRSLAGLPRQAKALFASAAAAPAVLATAPPLPPGWNKHPALAGRGPQMLRRMAVAGAVAVVGVFVLASPAGASAPATQRFAVPAPAAVTVPITVKYAGTFEVTPGHPSPCEGVPLTDTLTGTGSHLGLFTATYPHCVNFAANTFSGTATFKAPNGDLLFVHLGGSADDPACPATGICDVSFTGTINGGTGRFEGAEGTLTGSGTVDLHASTVTAALTGTINKDPQPF